MRHISLIIAVLALAIAAPAIAGKGNGNGNGGGGGTTSDQGGSPKAYAPSLGVTWPQQLVATSTNTSYVVSGCGYDASYGAVTLVAYSPAGAAWTGVGVDGNGCVSVSMFETYGVGDYRVEAWQHMRNKDVVVATTSFVVS